MRYYSKNREIYRQTVRSMDIVGSTIFHHDKRRFIRVPFERTVRLFFHNDKSRQYSAKNLSLGGMLLDCDGALALGQDCRVELHETGQRSSIIYKICGKIVHAGHNGLGIEFTEMEDHSLMYLQTMLLYSADDPVAAAEHFDEVFMFTTSPSSC